MLVRILFALLWVVVAILCIWLGLASKRGTLKRNDFAGYRLPVIQQSEETWKVAHDAAWKWTTAMAVGPAVGVVGTICARSEEGIVWWALIATIVVTVTCVGGTVSAIRAAKKVSAGTSEVDK